MFTRISRKFRSTAKGNRLHRSEGEAKVKSISMKGLLGHGRASALAAVAILTILMAGVGTAQRVQSPVQHRRQPQGQQRQVVYRDGVGRYWFHSGMSWHYYNGRHWQTCQSPMAVPNPPCGPSGRLTPVRIPSSSSARY